MRKNHDFKTTASATLVCSLLCCIPAIGLAHDWTGQAEIQNDASLQSDSNVRLPSVSHRVTIDDVQRARYDVLFREGTWADNSYSLAFVEKEGKATIIEAGADYTTVALTTMNMPDRVSDYLEMGPIIGIVGSRRDFAVGETYDSVMLRPEGRPHFRFTCDRMETVAGINGYHLIVKSVRYGNNELELVMSPDFPFPLYVREYTGANPLQITLTESRPLDVALGVE